MSEPCPRRTSDERKDAHDDSEAICSSAESKRQHQSLEERASVQSAAWYRAVKDIYDSGPEGEGQEVWAAWKIYQQARKEQQESNESAERKSSIQREMVSEGEKILAQAQHTRPLVPSHPPPPPPPPPPLPQVDTVQTQPNRAEESRAKSHTREDSCVSPSSIDIPVTIGDCVQRVIDTNKPLPAVPRAEPAPKTDETVCQMVPGSPPLTVEPHGYTKIVTKKPRSEAKPDNTWWQKRQSSKAQAKLKSKISHPVSLVASHKGSITNVAAECGGVGGPAAAVSLPNTRTGTAQPSNSASTTSTVQREVRKLPSLSFRFPPFGHNRMKSTPDLEGKDTAVVRVDMQPTKQSAKEKLNSAEMGRRRRSSDASFECQGIVERLDKHQVSETGAPSQDSGENKKSLLPEPLFSGMRGGKGAHFYQSYTDVLDEY